MSVIVEGVESVNKDTKSGTLSTSFKCCLMALIP
jgi:hypothetical protein